MNVLRRLKIQPAVKFAARSIQTQADSGKKKWAALWGNGDFGRLGLGSPASQLQPTLCRSLQHHQPQSIACGGAHTLILTEDKRVFAAGLNDHGQLGVSFDTRYTTDPIEVPGLPQDIKEIFSGYYHSAAITEEGIVYVWGSNQSGQLGLGKKAPKMVCTARKVEALNGLKITALALGGMHSLALTDDGRVISWGLGEHGRLGHGHQSTMFKFLGDSSEYTPKLLQSLEGVKVCKIAAGMTHSACADEKGTLLTFGQGTMFQLGIGKMQNCSIPSAVNEIPFTKEVACGGYHTCAISNNGDVYSWGSNENGCLGLGSINLSPLPKRVQGKLMHLNVSKVSCGWKHSVVISDGKIFTWGWGGSQGTFSHDGHSSGGQLGLGNEFDYFEPSQIKFDMHVSALQISCGFNHTAAIIEEYQSEENRFVPRDSS